MDAEKPEVTQKQLDDLLTTVLTSPDKTGPYWRQSEGQALDGYKTVPADSRIDNSSFFMGMSSDFEMNEPVYKPIHVFTLDVGMLLEQNGFSRRLFPRDVTVTTSVNGDKTQANFDGCDDKTLPLSSEDKQAIKDSITKGVHKITVYKFFQLVTQTNSFSLDELSDFYKEFNSFAHGGVLNKYAEIIFKHDSAVDPARVERERQALKKKPTTIMDFMGKKPVQARRPREDEGDGSAPAPREQGRNKLGKK